VTYFKPKNHELHNANYITTIKKRTSNGKVWCR